MSFRSIRSTRVTVIETTPCVPASRNVGGSDGYISALVAIGWTIFSWCMGKKNPFSDK